MERQRWMVFDRWMLSAQTRSSSSNTPRCTSSAVFGCGGECTVERMKIDMLAKVDQAGLKQILEWTRKDWLIVALVASWMILTLPICMISRMSTLVVQWPTLLVLVALTVTDPTTWISAEVARWGSEAQMLDKS